MAADIHDRPDVDHLYDLDPGEFVAGRDALAKDVRTEDREAAKAIKALRRPTVAAWAVNRAVRQRPADVERLLELGRAMQSGGSSLREAMGERRRLLASLADDAVDLAGEDHRAEIEPTLEAASLDEDVAARFRRGHLERAVEPSASGLEQLLAMPAEPSGTAGADDGRDDSEEERRRAAQARLDHAEEEITRRRQAVARAEDRLARARADLDEASEALRAAEADRDAAVADLEHG